jgi:hypothetical protein
MSQSVAGRSLFAVQMVDWTRAFWSAIKSNVRRSTPLSISSVVLGTRQELTSLETITAAVCIAISTIIIWSQMISFGEMLDWVRPAETDVSSYSRARGKSNSRYWKDYRSCLPPSQQPTRLTGGILGFYVFDHVWYHGGSFCEYCCIANMVLRR